MTADYIPRISFEISEELQQRRMKLLSTHGTLKAVMTPILEDLLDLIEEHGQIITGILIDRHSKPRDVIPSLRQAEKRAGGE